jgi:hypothetical protein
MLRSFESDSNQQERSRSGTIRYGIVG